MARIRAKTAVIQERHGKSIGSEATTMVFGELKRIRGS